MTILEAMTERATSEFDRMVSEREAEVRAGMIAAGCPRDEIEAHIADCQTRLAEQRALIRGNVIIALMKQGIALGESADVWQ